MASSAASAWRMAAVLAGVNGILTLNRGIVPSGPALPGTVMSAGWRAFGELGFELGDAPVCEAVVGAGGFQPFLQGLVVVGELADALLERGVLGDEPLRCLWRQVVFQVADLAQEDGHAASLGADLGVGFLQCCLGVEGAFPPGRFLVAAGGRGLRLLPACFAGGVTDQGAGVGVGVEEGA